MNKKQFLQNLQEMLQTETELNGNTVLTNIADWDSLAILTTVTFFDKNFGIILDINDINQCKTIADLMQKAGGKITDHD